MSLASIIIPVYNSEKHIGKCLDSIIAQTHREIEIIVINDGSDDGSQKIIDLYKDKYAGKIKTILQKNSGTAISRNTGLENADGDYIFFIDNDDYIDNDYIETFIAKAEESNADMVLGGYKRVEENGKPIHTFILEDTPWAPFRLQAPWARIYRRSFLKNNNLLFLDTKVGEDSSINIPATLKAKKIAIIKYTGYYWVNIAKSVSNTEQKKIKNADHVINMLRSIYEKTNFNEITAETYELLEYFYIKYSIWFLLFSGRGAGVKLLDDAYHGIFSNLEQLFPDYIKNKQISLLRPKGERFIVKITVSIIITLKKIGLDRLFFRLYSLI